MFKGKTFVLTGATKGIGYNIAQNLSKNNAKCIFISRCQKDLDSLRKDLKKSANQHKYIALDVSNEMKVKELFQQIRTTLSCIDGIINCAGTFGAIGKFDQVSPTEYLQTLQVNLMGAYHVCYYGFSFLQKAPRGKIINFAGGGATSAFPCYSGYATSKIALVKLTENMSIEYPSMDINCIAPGFINTPLANQTLAAGDKAGSFYEITLQMINERGGIDVKYAVELVQFLLSEKSNGITGKLISAPWDEWHSKIFQNKIRDEKDFCTLRRIDDKYFKIVEANT